MKKYIICSSKLTKSNGITALFRLQQELDKRGCDAYVYAAGADSDLKHKYLTKITEENRKNDIVVYPEIIQGNPLAFQNVVRWILYYPGKLRGSSSYDEYEKIFTFSEKFMPDCPVLLIPTLDETLFYSDDTEKNIDCYFVHKKGKWKNIPEFDSMTRIDMKYPETRKELADLLRRTKTLYSYDRNSLLLDEALKCGCVVKIVEQNGFSDYLGGYDEESKLFNEQIEYFIKETQSMDYKGKINKGNNLILLKNKLKFLYYKYITRNREKAERYEYRLW